MRQHILILLLAIPCLVFGQTPRSEIVKYRSYNQIKGDRLIREDSVILQINERMGDHDAEIHIPYSKGDKLSIGEAWIEDMAGNIVRKLKGKEIEDRSQISNISLYEDDFEKSFELKHNSYPYRIVYSYKITFSKFISAAAINHRNSRKPIKDGRIVVETSLDRPIAYKQENVDNPVIDTINNITRYTWAYSYAPVAAETNTSRNSSDAPIIHAIPLKFKFGTEGSVENWQTFGNWIHKLNEGRDMLTASEQEKINTLIKDARDDYEKVKYFTNICRIIRGI